ncbi:MAG: PAS domain S-box protein [Desulfovibrionaceae bacterium]|nr:PAS domain S-box protein [Desulfovibrionaceae bacterium]
MKKKQPPGAWQADQDVLCQILNSSDGLIFLKDKNLVYQGCNQAFASFAGKACADIVGATDQDLLPADMADILREMADYVITTRKKKSGHLSLQGFQGKSLALEATLAPIMNKQGRLQGVAGFLRDVTETRASKEHYLQVEAAYKSIFKRSDIGIAILSVTGPIIDVNEAMTHMLGYSKDELIGEKMTFLVQEPVREEYRARNADLLGGVRDCCRMDAPLKHKDGRMVWGHVNSVLTRSRLGTPFYAITMVEDITARKQAEAELASLTQHLEALVESRTEDLEKKAKDLADANQRLKEMDQIKTAFLSSVSHELRTPLTSLLGFAKLTGRDFETAFKPLSQGESGLEKKAGRILKNLLIIENEGERLTRLINDVLDLNKIEAGHIEWHDRPIDLEKVIRQAVRAVSGEFSNRPQVELVVDIEPDLPEIVADPDRLIQVLINLLNNAAKFTPQGLVRVAALEPRPGVAQVRVEDTGIGIPSASLERIFNKFQQASQGDTVQDKPKGTGLGLTICREIVDHYNGLIWAESEVGKGSTLIFELPAQLGAPKACRLPSARPAPSAAPRPRTGKPLILVVEDDQATSSFLCQILDDHGFDVETAFDGAAALAKAAAIRPDLITMDIKMPCLDGKSAITWIKKDPVLREIPILVVSVLQDAEAAGGDATLVKPVDPDKLMDSINGLLSLRHSEQKLIMLRRNGKEKLGPFFTLCSGNIEHCREDELWEKLDSGFEGTVIVPAWAAKTIDMPRLTDKKGVQVLLLPEQP